MTRPAYEYLQADIMKLMIDYGMLYAQRYKMSPAGFNKRETEIFLRMYARVRREFEETPTDDQ